MPSQVPMAVPDTIAAAWPAPARVRAIVTTRYGGISAGPYVSFNLATHCGDEPACVVENRRRLTLAHRMPSVCWLNQVHGRDAIDAALEYADPPTADASWSRSTARACAILSADCLPVLLCDRAGTVVAAAHCGWRGLAFGVLKELIGRLPARREDLLAWLGPAISAAHYQVGADVRDALARSAPASIMTEALRQASTDPHKWHADLYAIARAQLAVLGVQAVFGGGFCVYREAKFYSYRRDGATGRFASLIWLADDEC